jgi:hypothetical protein
MFVSASNFNVVPYKLPGLDIGDALTEFPAYIIQEVEDRLVKIIGRTLYDAFIEGCFQADGVTAKDDADIEQRWKDLRDGVAYRYNDKPYYWEGMEKLFTPYIYSMWTRDTADSHTKNGITVPVNENSTTISPAMRISRAFNAFSVLVGSECLHEDTLYGFLYNSGDTYLDVVADDYSSIQSYMTEVFKNPGNMNAFGI